MVRYALRLDAHSEYDPSVWSDKSGMKKLPLRLVVLASGQGRNFQAIAKGSLEGKLSSRVVGLISNRACGAIEKAQELGVPNRILPWGKDQTSVEWGQRLLLELEQLQPDWILLAGFLKILSPAVVQKYKWRILNLHPSLLPKYGGPGMFGAKVFSEIVRAKESETGATLHFVTEKFDEGPILNQVKIPVHDHDTSETLMNRTQLVEPEFYVETLLRLEKGEFDPLIQRLKG